MNQITIHFDGGCGPTNPGNKYGSYEVQISGKTGLVSKYQQFGWGTNILISFKGFKIQWQPRQKNVERFGH